MPPSRKTRKDAGRHIDSYQHTGQQRLNNPPVGLVDPRTDPETPAQTYAYDPHLDPQLQWAGKAEHTSFEVPTVSLHVHERIDPLSIIASARKQAEKTEQDAFQLSLFGSPAENPPLRDAVQFYQHRHGWSNRMVAGDSLLVMNSLLEKEGLGGQVQMIYIDPPYGIKYGSNFQPFVNKRDVKDGKDEDLTAEPEQVLAFRDTWELGIHSYLTYLRDRLLLARELLHESGSVFVQISDDNVHHVRELMDDIFGSLNYCAIISFVKTTSQTSKLLASINDYLLWYGKDIGKIKYRQLFLERNLEDAIKRTYQKVELQTGEIRNLTQEEINNPNQIPDGSKLLSFGDMVSQSGSESTTQPFEFDGRKFFPRIGGWKTNLEGLMKLGNAGRLGYSSTTLLYKRYFDDFPYTNVTSFWEDTKISGFYKSEQKIFVVQTAKKVIQRCLLMTTDPGDLVLDPTCGSGTTAFVAEQWGRRWITCDTSRVALTLARTRLMTAVYDYYELAHPAEGVGSGFKYQTVPHITLKSIANDEPPGEETLYDKPLVDRKVARVSGPFTIEAVPAPAVRSVDDLAAQAAGETPPPADAALPRSGESLRQSEWRDELLRTGIRGKSGQKIEFARLEALPGCRSLHAVGETRPSAAGADRVAETAPAYQPMRVAVSFGPQHAPFEQRQIESAIEEARTLVPQPQMLVFAAFQFDPEAAKDIDAVRWPGVTLLKAQMNADLNTADLKKKRASNQSFWLIGQPDVELLSLGADQYGVQVHGFDYYNTKTGELESGSSDRIAVWLLDPDYDGRSLFPRQVFFPMASAGEGWEKLKRSLKAELDEDLIEAFHGALSLPFTAGQHRRAAVKIVDDRGIESLKILGLD